MSTGKFQSGQVVISNGNAVLVTGAGTAEYPAFSGVVVMAITDDDEETGTWPVGTRSETWSTAAFVLSGIDLSEVVRKAIGRSK